MSLYVVIAYRWGHTNDSWYFVYAGEDESKALALADSECHQRGGKYGVAVFEVQSNGEGLSMYSYFPSSNEEEPFMNWRIETVQRLGHLIWDYHEGTILLPVDDGSLPGAMRSHPVTEPLPAVLSERVEHLKRQSKFLADTFNRSRDEAREAAQRVWCPMCGEGPLYLVEYASTFRLLPNRKGSPEIEVEGLRGRWCMHCEQMHLTSDQATSNLIRISAERTKAAKAAMGKDATL